MRIGLLIYGSLETVSGGFLYDRKLVEHLQRQGDLVEIISLPWRNYARHLGDNLSPALRQRLQDAQLDILLQDELNYPSLFWLNQHLRGSLSYPIISIVHHLRSSELHPAWQMPLYRAVERRYLASVDGFIFNSQTTRQAAQAAGADLNRQAHVVAYPAGDQLQPDISDDEIRQRAIQPGPLHLLFLGNVIPRKGLHTLLEALSRLPAESWQLKVVGSLTVDKTYARAIQRQIVTAQLGDNVNLCGSLTDELLAAEMRASHALVVPSTYEGFGIVYLEGMGFGLPAIAATSGAAGEIISHGQDGYLIPPGDAVALAQCLAELANDRQRLAELSLAARRRYLAHPTWEQTAARLREFLVALAHS